MINRFIVLTTVSLAINSFAAPVAAKTQTTKKPDQITQVENSAKAVGQSLDKSMGQVTGNKPSILQKKLHSQERASIQRSGIALYEPNYILPFYYTASPAQGTYGSSTPDQQPLKHLEFKGQISLSLPIWKTVFGYKNTNLNVAYTQSMFWQFYAKSQYFREVDYMPEIFTRTQLRNNWWLSVGVVHQSNGRGGEFERSWNRAYTDLMFSGEHWMVSIKPWVLIFKSDSSDLHNPKIARYMGNGRVLMAYKYDNNELTLMLRNNLQSQFRKGAQEITWGYHIRKHATLYLQVFNGYGQSLIEYNHRTLGIGAGIALNNWL